MDERRTQQDRSSRRTANHLTATRWHAAQIAADLGHPHGDDLYVRSVNGPGAAWFRGVQARHEGRIQAGGVEKEVTFVEDTDFDINDGIDGAYKVKYRRYPGIVSGIVNPEARAATLKLVPRDNELLDDT